MIRLILLAFINLASTVRLRSRRLRCSRDLARVPHRARGKKSGTGETAVTRGSAGALDGLARARYATLCRNR